MSFDLGWLKTGVAMDLESELLLGGGALMAHACFSSRALFEWS